MRVKQVWVSNLSEEVTVSLEEANKDDVCVLSQDLISTSTFDFENGLEDSHYFPDDPEICKAVLPCGHSFSLLLLMFHFLCNSMQCPTCRRVFGSKMSLDSVPSHLREAFQKRLTKVMNFCDLPLFRRSDTLFELAQVPDEITDHFPGFLPFHSLVEPLFRLASLQHDLRNRVLDLSARMDRMLRNVQLALEQEPRPRAADQCMEQKSRPAAMRKKRQERRDQRSKEKRQAVSHRAGGKAATRARHHTGR